MYRFFFYNFEYYVLSEIRINYYYDQIFWDMCMLLCVQYNDHTLY